MSSCFVDQTDFSPVNDQPYMDLVQVPSNGGLDFLDLDSLNQSTSQDLTNRSGNMLNNPTSQLPLNFYFSQMGPAAYTDIVEKGPLLVHGPHGQLRRTNSLFSDHITVVEHFLKQKWKNAGALLNKSDDW